MSKPNNDVDRLSVFLEKVHKVINRITQFTLYISKLFFAYRPIIYYNSIQTCVCQLCHVILSTVEGISTFIPQIYFEQVAAESRNEKSQEEDNDILQRVNIVLESVFQFVFTSDKRFRVVFEKPSPDLGKYDGIETLSKTNTDNFKCRLFLKKFTHPGSCVVSQ